MKDELLDCMTFVRVLAPREEMSKQEPTIWLRARDKLRNLAYAREKD